MRITKAIRRFLQAQRGSVSSATSRWYARQLVPLAHLHRKKLRALKPSDVLDQWLRLTKKQNAGQRTPVDRQ